MHTSMLLYCIDEVVFDMHEHHANARTPDLPLPGTSTLSHNTRATIHTAIAYAESVQFV